MKFLPAAAAFVAQRPDDDGGMVLEVLDVGHAAVDDRVAHPRLVVEAAVVAVALAVGLGHQPDAPLVAQFVPPRVVGVMAGADVVAVALLEDFQVADHLRLGDGVAHVGPMLVPVGALELDGRAVDEELPALDLDLAETDAGGEEFRSAAALRSLAVAESSWQPAQRYRGWAFRRSIWRGHRHEVVALRSAPRRAASLPASRCPSCRRLVHWAFASKSSPPVHVRSASARRNS